MEEEWAEESMERAWIGTSAACDQGQHGCPKAAPPKLRRVYLKLLCARECQTNVYSPLRLMQELPNGGQTFMEAWKLTADICR